MQLVGFLYFEPAVEHLVDNSSLMGHELEQQADRIVERAKQNVSTPYVRGQLNPGPYPRLRTGDFRQGIMRTSATETVGPHISVEVVSVAVHRGWPYPRSLHDGTNMAEIEYQIVTDADLAALGTS